MLALAAHLASMSQLVNETASATGTTVEKRDLPLS